LKLTNSIKRRSQRALEQVREEARAPTTPEERFLAERVERSKLRLREASRDLESRMRWVSWASAAGLAFLRWRSNRNKPKDRKRRRF
jgi:predicted nicotinamide N-methyase